MRKIYASIKGWETQLSAKTGGVQGETNATALILSFDESWRGYGKRIVWRDATGANPVTINLFTFADTDDGDMLYTVAIPAEPLALPGFCTFTVEGYKVEYDADEQPHTVVAMAATAKLEVLPAPVYYTPSAEPTPSEYTQLMDAVGAADNRISEFFNDYNTLKGDLNAAEELRVGAENDRVDAVGAADNRISEFFNDYNTLKGDLNAAEELRVGAENDRVDAELLRANAERLRDIAEGGRAAAETSRAGAEAERRTAETERTEAESGRVAAENDRDAAERARADENTGIVAQATAQAQAAESSATAAAGSATAAATAAETAQSANSAAATSASAAATSEANAAASATAAAGSAAAAATSEAHAATSETNAATSAASAEASAEIAVEAAEAATEAAATAKSICRLRVTLDGGFEQYTIQRVGGSEMRTGAVPEDGEVVLYVHNDTTYRISSTDGTGKGREVVVTTGPDLGEYTALLEGAVNRTVRSVAGFVAAVDAGETEMFRNHLDLEVDGLDFKTAVTDEERWLCGDMLGAPITPANIGAILSGMKADYEALEGEGSWAALATNTDTQVKAWYLVQYYLFNRSFVAPEGDETVLDATAAEGMAMYWWKDRWNGLVNYSGLYYTISSKIEAHFSWILHHATDPEMDLSDPVVAKKLTMDLRGYNNTVASWSDIVSEARAIIDARQYVTYDVWRMLQFVLLHPDASMTQNNTAEYQRDLHRLANREADAFYWWLNGGTATATAIPTPVAPAPASFDPDQDLAVTFGEDHDSNIVPNARLMMTNLLLAMATGNTAAAETVTEDALVDIVTGLRIRNELATTTTTLRKDLTKYTSADKATLKASLENLVRQVYEDVASVNLAAGFADWDYVTNWDHTTHTGSGKSVFTYVSAAYNAVCALTPEQIQHWLSTGSYDSAEAEAADYWWLQNAPKVVPPPEDLARFIHTLLYWGNKGNVAKVKAAIQLPRESYGWAAFYDSTVSTAVSRISVSNIKNKILVKAKTDSYKFNWAMFEAYIRRHTAYKAADAIAYAGDDVRYADIVFQFSAALVAQAPPLADSDITMIYLSDSDEEDNT